MAQNKWQFWVDRGGTFTDLVARRPDGDVIVHKVLSENPEQYKDAAVQGIREILNISKNDILPMHEIEAIKMGTTVGTNALLERKGEPTLLVITKGLRDQLRIAYQQRPAIFARHIILPEMLYQDVVEANERMGVDGTIVTPLDMAQLEQDLKIAYDKGLRACAILFMHGYRYPTHENHAAEIAKKIGFTQISVSHQVSPLVKLVGRGDTTVVDAYLSPILRRYVGQLSDELGYDRKKHDTKIMFMQSNGGLTDADYFQGKDCILSGPAGGIVGAVRTSEMAGFDKIITFDMGGTSTDVAHYAGEYERSFETQVAGVRMRAPMMYIHTVAAGGGSICYFDGTRYRVGPESAGANPGPAAYRRGGPLCVTDCNVMVGKLQPDLFPKIFGEQADKELDVDIVRQKFTALAAEIGDGRSPEQVAEGFIKIAVLNMARAIKKISVQRGYNVADYTLCSFGGAGGQHACLVADSLGMKRVFIHSYSGVLSAYGMGLADLRQQKEVTVEEKLSADLLKRLQNRITEQQGSIAHDIEQQGFGTGDLRFENSLFIKYQGTDKAHQVPFGTLDEVVKAFNTLYEQRFGFLMAEKPLIVETLSVEGIAAAGTKMAEKIEKTADSHAAIITEKDVFMQGAWHKTPVYNRADLGADFIVNGPAIIQEKIGTIIVEPSWTARINDKGHLVLEKQAKAQNAGTLNHDVVDVQTADPIMLEIFNNLFMSIAEQMGLVLENTAYSVNIKERLDFSCALFDKDGGLLANAPHMPVHLGSMGESIRAIIKVRQGTMKPGDVYMLNNPYDGGTHLPDITVISPVFDKNNKEILFYVASRGHHADVGGKTPGSMPPDSVHIDEEGVLITNFQMVSEGRFLEQEVRDLFLSHQYPARNVEQNIADLKAQIAANRKGITELLRMIDQFGLDVVQAYTKFVQDNAEELVRRVLDVLSDGQFVQKLDNGAEIHVKITIDKKQRSAVVDFTGTSPQLDNNFNAPSAVCRAAVLYVFRTLVDDEIPMNEGCLKPVTIIIPEGCMLRPRYPAPVVAGNVETSQCVTDALYGALQVLAAAQGTMNNFTYGNDRYQYYETICGGSGAGPTFDGTSAVQTHMTNSRLTDPEILEMRFPVRLEEFSIRYGSGGAGQYHGGDGVVRKVRFLEPMTASLLSNHHHTPPFGIKGGGNGAFGKAYVLRTDGTIQKLNSTDRTEMQAGDIFVVESPGGGGFGKKSA